MSDTQNSIHRIYEKQQAKRWELALTNAEQRINKLKRLKTALMDRREEAHQALLDDFSKNPGETDLTELLPVVAEINHTVKHLKHWMKPKRVRTPMLLKGTHSHVRYEAKGLVLILSPWNYPLNLCLNPVLIAMAAGNCVMLKPSSKVPRTAQFIKSLLSDLYPEDEVAVFTGSSEISDQLLELRFDHIFFTGSPRVGQHIMSKAAKFLTPVTLELGGKSPVIVDRTADIKKAADRVMWGKFVNAGQTCLAPDYLFIHRDRLNPFLTYAKQVLEKRFGSDETARRNEPSFCRLVSKGHHQGLAEILKASVKQGATIEFGGGTDVETRFLEPTLLTNVNSNTPIMQEEIFGPILPIMTFEDLSEPIRFVQEREKPLAIYIFSTNSSNIEKLLKNTTAGGSSVNTTLMHFANPNLPFGGIGNSGQGSYHGLFGFKNLSHERAVLRQGAPDTLRLFYPPYTPGVKGLIHKAMKYLA